MTSQIFVLDDEKVICELYSEMIKKYIGHCDVFTFTNSKDMLEHPRIKKTNLFIVDVNLGSETGCEVMNKVVKKIDRSLACLFVSGHNYDIDDFYTTEYTYDYISKPVNSTLLINRIRVLLQVSEKYKLLEHDKSLVEGSLLDLINYSNLYVLILDSKMKIKLCSSLLAKDLGYDDSSDLRDKCWMDFIPYELKENIYNVFDNIMGRVEVVDDFREVTNPVIPKTGEKIIVKWFNTKITNGDNYAFSIGIPISKPITKEDSITSIRSYWSDIIESDRTTIDSLKNIVKNSHQQRDHNTCSET